MSETVNQEFLRCIYDSQDNAEQSQWYGLSRAKTWEDQGISDREVRDRLKQARDAVGRVAEIEADDA